MPIRDRPPKEARNGFLEYLALREDGIDDWDRFPFCIPAVRDLNKIVFHPAVTFLVGENGSGKSTILEAIAIRLGHGETGGPKAHNFNMRELDGGLHDAMVMKHSYIRKPAETFFMRAETVFDFTAEIEREMREHAGYGRDFRNYGGKSLNERSHGEAFLAIVQHRFKDESLFVMDEPEAALSPIRQMTLLKEIDILVSRGCQLIVATHSPIVLSYPDATIYALDGAGISETTYEATEHFQITKSFINNPKSFLHRLLD